MITPTQLSNQDAVYYGLLMSLKNAVISSLDKLEVDQKKLLLIRNDNKELAIRREVVKYYRKNQKLISIANELLTRINSYLVSIKDAQLLTNSKADTDHFALEVELLREMHFAVAKTYTTFIYQYANKRVANTTSIAA